MMASSHDTCAPGKKQRLSRRFFTLIMIYSFSALLLSAAVEIWLGYQNGLQRIENNLRLIQDSYLPAIETSLYAVDQTQIKLLLKGMLNLEGIVFCEVQEKSESAGITISEGDARLIQDDGHRFVLAYWSPGGVRTAIGTLSVYTHPSGLFGQLWRLTAAQLLVFSVMIFLSALIIMGLFQKMVARHLFQMARFARGIDLAHLNAELTLPRRPRQDELEEVAVALKAMQAQLIRDISQRNAWEKQLKAERDLNERVMETSPAGIVRVDAQGRLVYVNKRAEIILGVQQTRLADIDYHDPAWKITGLDGQAFPEEQLPFAIVRKTNQPVFDVQHAVEWPNGRRVMLSINAAPLQDPSGAFEGMVATIEDITERKRLEAQLQQAQRMEAIGSLAGGIAHDFNNILSPIIGFADLLLEDLTPGSMEYENAREIVNAGMRGRELVKQILAISRRSERQLAPVRVQQIVKEVLKLIRSTIPSNIEIHQEIQNDCDLVMADATQLHQVGMNLLTNAFHAVEANSGKISVSLKQIELGHQASAGTELAPGRYAKLTVSDTGCGMDASILSKIFTPYFSTKAQGKGTGLGLAIAYGIVKEHHGDIQVHSEVGRGTTFTVHLPLMAKSTEPMPALPIEKDPTGTEHILLVDDEVPVVNLMKLLLERLGYRLSAHVGSIEALEAFKRTPYAFDLIISDMAMPNMTGDELARAVMAIRQDIPIIICTGFSERLDQHSIAALGIKGLLMKPVVKSELAQMVRRVLDHH